MPAHATGAAVPTVRPTWYAGGDNWYGEAWTMLHLPYTGMVLSFVTIGGVLAPTFSGALLAITLTAYFLALGIGAHFLDQLPGMGSRYVFHWPSRALWAIGLASLGAAAGIGIYGAVTSLGVGLLVLVAVQVVCALGYALAPLFRGLLHRESVFAISWGALPFVTGYYAQAGTLTVPILVLSAAFAAIAIVEIRISRISRELRRAARAGGSAAEGEPPLYRTPDLALIALSVGTILLGLGLLLNRIYPAI